MSGVSRSPAANVAGSLSVRPLVEDGNTASGQEASTPGGRAGKRRPQQGDWRDQEFCLSATGGGIQKYFGRAANSSSSALDQIRMSLDISPAPRVAAASAVDVSEACAVENGDDSSRGNDQENGDDGSRGEDRAACLADSQPQPLKAATIPARDAAVESAFREEALLSTSSTLHRYFGHSAASDSCVPSRGSATLDISPTCTIASKAIAAEHSRACSSSNRDVEQSIQQYFAHSGPSTSIGLAEVGPSSERSAASPSRRTNIVDSMVASPTLMVEYQTQQPKLDSVPPRLRSLASDGETLSLGGMPLESNDAMDLAECSYSSFPGPTQMWGRTPSPARCDSPEQDLILDEGVDPNALMATQPLQPPPALSPLPRLRRMSRLATPHRKGGGSNSRSRSRSGSPIPGPTQMWGRSRESLAATQLVTPETPARVKSPAVRVREAISPTASLHG